MATRYLIGNLVDGRRRANISVLSGSWSDDLDVPETISATIKLNNTDSRLLNVKRNITPVNTYLAAIDTGAFGQDGKVLAAGPIWSTVYDRTNQTLELSARGIQSIFDHRYVLPPSARTASITTWTIPDPADPSGIGTIPNPALATTFSGLSLGGIMVSLVTQALAWTGGSLPIVLPSIETGTATRTYNAVDFKTVGSAITDLINVDGGPEVRFTPRFTADQLSIEWVMTVGTTAKPLLYRSNVTSWNVTVPESPVRNLTVNSEGSDLATIAWATAGRSTDSFIVSRAISAGLSGYPLTEYLNSTRNDIELQATLDLVATGDLKLNSVYREVWSFQVKAHPIDRLGTAAGPQLDDYDVGDFINLHIDPYDDKTDRGDLWMPDGGDVALRIVGISGDEFGEDVTIKCAPVVG